MRIIDADKYRKDLLSTYDDVSMELEVLDRQPLASAIPIPEGATNGDAFNTLFDIDEDVEEIEGKDGYVYLKIRADVWDAPYKGECNLSEKPTGSESEDNE